MRKQVKNPINILKSKIEYENRLKNKGKFRLDSLIHEPTPSLTKFMKE